MAWKLGMQPSSNRVAKLLILLEKWPSSGVTLPLSSARPQPLCRGVSGKLPAQRRRRGEEGLHHPHRHQHHRCRQEQPEP